MKKHEYINAYCTGCGLCHSVNGTSIHEIEKGFPNAEVQEGENISFFENTCPVFYYTGECKHDVWGIVEKALTGYSSDKEVRFKAASGGALTELCSYLLESGQVDGVLHTTYDPQDQTKNLSCISRTREELVERCGSRYSISVPLSDLTNLLEAGKRYAFVGKPCDVMALRRYLEYQKEMAEQIVCLLSFFCAGEPSDDAQTELLSSMGCKREDCASITYRGNGWPGYTTVVKKDGTKLTMEYKDAWGKHLGRDLRNICRFCMDGTGDAADLVCADFWQLDETGYPDFSEHEGRNIVIARTKYGRQVLDAAVEAGNLTVEEDFTDKMETEFHKYQPAQYRRKGTMGSMIAGMKLCGKSTPEYSKEYLKTYGAHVGTKEKMRYFLGIVKRVIRKRI